MAQPLLGSEHKMGLDELKAKYQEEKDERKKKKISEMMLGESRVMCRFLKSKLSDLIRILSIKIFQNEGFSSRSEVRELNKEKLS